MNQEEKLAALNSLLKHAQKSAFYQGRLPEKTLNSLTELRGLPLTTKDELRRCSPYDLLCVPRQELFQYHETFGTTGSPISIWYTKEDFLRSSQNLAYWGVNFGRDDLVLIRFPYAIATIAHLVHAAAQCRGAFVIPASSLT